jgi:hypothetical protein
MPIKPPTRANRAPALLFIFIDRLLHNFKMGLAILFVMIITKKLSKIFDLRQFRESTARTDVKQRMRLFGCRGFGGCKDDRY